MGIGSTIKGLFEKLKQNVQYECSDCDYEAAKKRFDKRGDSLVCPHCGGQRVRVD